MEITHERTSRGRPELYLRYPYFPSRFDRKAHDPIRHHTRNRRHQPLQQQSKRTQTVPPSGVAKRRHFLGGVAMVRREAVGDGLEAEVRQSGDGGVAMGADEAVVVEVGVDEGHVEAT